MNDLGGYIFHICRKYEPQNYNNRNFYPPTCAAKLPVNKNERKTVRNGNMI